MLDPVAWGEVGWGQQGRGVVSDSRTGDRILSTDRHDGKRQARSVTKSYPPSIHPWSPHTLGEPRFRGGSEQRNSAPASFETPFCMDVLETFIWLLAFWGFPLNLVRGVHPLIQWCILQLLPYFHKIYKCPPVSTKFINFLHISGKFIHSPLSAKFTFSA